MTDIWYKTISWRPTAIEAVTVERTTDSCVWIKGRRFLKESQGESFWGSWKDAHDHLLLNAESHVLSLRRRLEEANGRLGNVKGMKPPTEAEPKHV